MKKPSPDVRTPSVSPIEAERLQLFVTGVTDYAIYMLSPEGIISSWNAGAQRFKGYTPEEIIGQHFSRFYTEEDRATGLPARALKTAIEQGKFEDEGWRVRKDGTRFRASVLIDPIRDSNGNLIGFTKITRDVTERRAAEQELAQAREALFQAQKLEAIGKLTGGVAHDFNNLLNVIVTGLEILEREAHSPTSRRVVDSMQRAASRGAALTQQLLTFARKQPLQQTRCNVNRVIGSFEAVLRRVGIDAVNFDISLAPELPCVLIDAAQFEAALLNLVVNARDATPDGGSVSLSTESVALGHNQVAALPAGTYVKVTVKDTGAGMPPEVAARAIEPFFTTKPVGKGTGLGLSQVYGMMQQSGGDLAIASEPGKGTEISLYFPALSGATHEGGQTAAASDRVLVVDDQPDVLEMAVELFAALGYEVLSANSGEDALEVLKRAPDIGVLFTDIVMPGISGLELARKARVLTPGLKIILASGYASPALENDAGLEEFEFIGKPYRMADIARKLRAA